MLTAFLVLISHRQLALCESVGGKQTGSKWGMINQREEEPGRKCGENNKQEIKDNIVTMF